MNDTVTLSREEADQMISLLVRARNVINKVNPNLGKQLDDAAMGVKGHLLGQPREAARSTEPDSADPVAKPNDQTKDGDDPQ